MFYSYLKPNSCKVITLWNEMEWSGRLPILIWRQGFGVKTRKRNIYHQQVGRNFNGNAIDKTKVCTECTQNVELPPTRR